MKKFFAIILALVLALSLGVTALATDGSSGSSVDTFDPALEITTSADGKTITVKMNDLPEGLSAELVIPCNGWSSAVVKDSSGKTISSTFGDVDVDPSEITETVKAVTFEASGGTYTITKVDAPATTTTPSSGGSTYYSDLNDFSNDIVKDIEKAQKGDIVEIELGDIDKIAATVITALRSNPDVGLKITKNGKVVVQIPAGKAQANEAGRVYYSIETLADLYGQYIDGDIPAAETPVVVPEEKPIEPSEEPEEEQPSPEKEPEPEAPEAEETVTEEPEVEEPVRSSIGGAPIAIGIGALALLIILFILLRKKKEQV